MTKRNICLLIVCLFECVGMAQAQFTSHTRPSPLEFASLPTYCQDLLEAGNNLGHARQKWLPMMGETIIHMHHYCYGLIAQMRAERVGRTPQQRAHSWRLVVGELDYVIQRTTTAFVLYPELMYRRGFALAKLDRDGEAIAAFNESARVKPDYFPAYRALAELYRKRGKIELAREAVREGLGHAPNAKSLQDLAKELGVTGWIPAVPATATTVPKNGAGDPRRAQDAASTMEQGSEVAFPERGDTTSK